MAWEEWGAEAGRFTKRIREGHPVDNKSAWVKRLVGAFASILFLVALALAAPLIFIKDSQDFGLVYENERGVSEQRDLWVSAVGEQVRSYDVASRVGGVILQATAAPESTAEAKTIALGYDPSKQDGGRFSVSFGTQNLLLEAPDWLIVPLARFVDTPATAAISLLGEPKTSSERRVVAKNPRLMFVETHPVFRNTVCGNNFLFTDAMLVDANPHRIRRITESLSEPIMGYSDTHKFDEARSKAAADSIRKTVSDGNFDTYIFTDLDVQFTYGIQDQKLVLHGQPYYLFLALDDDTKTTSEDEALTRELRGSKRFSDLNPKIYGLDERLFQLSAFFRAVKAKYPPAWSQFMKSISGVTVIPTVRTPRAWIRG
jgi:hypothetical protein